MRWEEVDQAFGLLRQLADNILPERPGDLLRVTCEPSSGRGDILTCFPFIEASAATVPVDIWLAGSPPSPFGMINSLLIAVGQLASKGKGTR